MAGVYMNDPRLMLPGRPGLRVCCFAVIVGGVVAGCQTSSSTNSNAPPATSAAASATSAAAAGGSASATTGTDTNSNVLGDASGGGGSSGYSVPVKASGDGSESTVPFMVSDSVLLVSYSFDCSASGGSGFTADLISGSAASPGSDDESIADESGTSDTASVTLSMQDTPGDYYLQVNSPCTWAVDVEDG
jgi:hypothetical protein